MPEDNPAGTATATVDEAPPATEATTAEVDVNAQMETQTQEAATATSAEAQTAEAPTNTNINDLSLDQQVDNEDPEADADAVVLPREGIHILRLKAGKKGVYGPTTDKDGNPLQQPKLDKNNRAFFVAEVEAYLVHENPKYDGIRIFNLKDALSAGGIYLTSLVQDRTNTSAAADVANKTGYPFQKGATLGQRRDHMQQLLAAEPSIKAMIQWQAAKETGEQDENGYPVRTIALRGEKSFPELRDSEGNIILEDGVPLHNPRVTLQDGQEVVGRAVITRFLPIGG